MSMDILNALPDPDVQGESLYRAVYEELEIWLGSIPVLDEHVIATQFADELRVIATLIEQTVATERKKQK